MERNDARRNQLPLQNTFDAGAEPDHERDELDQLTTKLSEIPLRYLDHEGELVDVESAMQDAYELIAASSLPKTEKADFLLNFKTEATSLCTNDLWEDILDTRLKKQYLPMMLGPEVYQEMSQEVGRLLRAESSVPKGYFGEFRETDSEHETNDDELEELEAHVHRDNLVQAGLPTLASFSPEVRTFVIDRLVDSKLIIAPTHSYEYPAKKTAQKYLLSGALELAEGWRRAKARASGDNEIHSLDDAEEALDHHNKERAISEVHLETGKPGFTVAPLNSLKIGHQDGLDGLKLVRNYVERLDALPENFEAKPDVLLVTDLMQGVFKHSQSQKRSLLAEGFQSSNAQYRVAHLLLNELKATGIPVVVSMSENDHREAKDYAIGAVREIEGLLSDAEKNDFVHFAQIYKYTQNALFQDFRKFALDYAIPLSQKFGRRLRTSDELYVDTGGRISQSEFMYAYQHVKFGHRLIPEVGISEEDIIELGTWNADKSLIYVDDCNLVMHTNDGREETIEYRHALGLTAESLLGNHMINPMKLMGSVAMAATSGDTLPTALMTGQQQEAVMATHSGADIISNTGLTNPMDSLSTRAFNRRTTGDTSLRAFTTRRRAWTPGIYEYSRPAKGVVRYTLYDKDILERSESIPRMAIITFNDWQIGSPTAHPDLVLHAQALAQQYADRMPVAIHGEGDFKHGFIYPNMAREAQAVGLFDLDSQSEVTNGLIADTWTEAPKVIKKGVFDVMWLPGNHDEAQRVRLPANHSRNVDDTMQTWREVLDNEDVVKDDTIVRTERVFQSHDGTPVPTWIGRPRYGDVNMAIAHFHINSKNYKGGSGGLAVYDPFKRLEGMGIYEDVQIASGAHHHNRMHTKVNGTWIDIGDANAAGQSEFESMLGMHHSNNSVKVREIGGGLPETITYYTEEPLMAIPIEYGPYSKERLADAGYFDDPGANPLAYSMYSVDGSPRTAEQKRLWVKHREASQWARHMSEELIVPRGHQNKVTQRLTELALEKALYRQ